MSTNRFDQAWSVACVPVLEMIEERAAAVVKAVEAMIAPPGGAAANSAGPHD